jgi:hypothetical protein
MSSALVTSLGRPEHPCGCPVHALSRKAPEPGQGAPPCTFRRTHKIRDDADCPAGGSSRSSPAPAHGGDAMRILTGSRARNSPGTVLKVTAWVGSIQIGMPPHGGSSARVTKRSPRDDAHAEQPAYRMAGLFHRRRRFDRQRCNKTANGSPGQRSGADPKARPADTAAVCRVSQSRFRPRLASSRRMASPVPGPKAG